MARKLLVFRQTWQPIVPMGQLHRVSPLLASLLFAATAVAQEPEGHEHRSKSAASPNLRQSPGRRARVSRSTLSEARGTSPETHGSLPEARGSLPEVRSESRSKPESRSSADPRESREARSKAEEPRAKSPEEHAKSCVPTRTHRIVSGDSLSGIAALYGSTVEVIAKLNKLKAHSVLRVGHELLVPQPLRPGGGNDWIRYARAPEQSGVVDLVAYRSRYRGRVIENGELSSSARHAVSALLGVQGSRPPVPERLLRLLVRVSDTFGGREIRIVSGYRTTSFFADSRHKMSSAVDFSINGVPNSVLRQYLLLFDNVGVGYYPNSSFVHLDVRNDATQWVDYAGPGEAPRSTPNAPRVAAAPSISELNELAAQVSQAMAEARTSRHREGESGTSDNPL